MKAGRCGYFWKENFAKFARNPLKTLAVAWPCQCVKQPERQHLLLQGLHPSRAGHRRPGWFSGGPQVGDSEESEDSGRRGSWMQAPSRSPGQVATPCQCPSGSGCPYAGDTLRTFANGRVAKHPVDRSELALVFRD